MCAPCQVCIPNDLTVLDITMTIDVINIELAGSGVDPGFLESGFICIKVWGFALLILSHFS